jgi:polysaccharide transporter, PST family
MSQASTINVGNREAAATDVARLAGRGTIYITAAKVWFMISGYGIHFILPRLLSKPEFGVYQFVIGVVSVVNAVVVTGTSQAVSKYISQDETKAGAVKSKALKLQVLVGGVIAGGFALLAGVIAGSLHDDHLTNLLRLASLITFSYSFYSVFTGYFNGQKRFLTQAAVDMSYSTLKLLFVVLFVWLGYGVTGGVGGFALAAACVLALSAFLARGSSSKGDVRAADLLSFQVYVLLFIFVLNLLQKVDLILIKALSSTDAVVASANVGSYSASINVANITYQIVISIAFVIFPLVSQATFAQDRQRTHSYVSNTIRYVLMIMMLPATLFSANASAVLRLVYPEEYQEGSTALAIVAYGILFFGLLYVLTTIISASGRPTVSLGIGVATLAASAALNAMLIPRFGLAGAAAGTSIAMVFGAILSGGYAMSKFGALMPAVSVARIVSAGCVIYLLSLLAPHMSKPLTVVKLGLLSIVYVLVLVITREIGKSELNAARRVIGA